MNNAMRMVSTLLLLAFTAFGVVIARVGFVITRRSRRSAGWPRTTGTVLGGDMLRSETPTASDIRVGYSVTYEPHVRHEYAVAGRRYENARLTHAAQPQIPDSAAAQGQLSKYPVGGQVTVFYDPENPSDSVLVPGSSTGNAFCGVAPR